MLKTIRTNFDRQEARRDRRYPLPAITVTLGSSAFATGNWSLGGFMLPAEAGFALGATVAGDVALTEPSQSHAFTAEVVRCDPAGIGFRFVEPSMALIGALDRAIAGRMFRQRA